MERPRSGSVADISELPDAGRASMVYVSLDQHLPVYSYHLALVEQSDGQRRTFLYRVVSLVDLYAISEPLVRRSVGTVLLERIPYAVVFLRLLRLSCARTLYTCPSDLEPFQTFYYRNCFDAHWCSYYHIFVLCSGRSRRNTPHARAGNRVGFLHHQLCVASAGTFLMFSCIELPELRASYWNSLNSAMGCI